ncbi:MAG TPA: hypothetical protein VLI90_02920 [Tepidisphaeraceae bacterium]|nr:hypothetical protein [Tepidisphaeraceae bacterium]
MIVLAPPYAVCACGVIGSSLVERQSDSSRFLTARNYFSGFLNATAEGAEHAEADAEKTSVKSLLTADYADLAD